MKIAIKDIFKLTYFRVNNDKYKYAFTISFLSKSYSAHSVLSVIEIFIKLMLRILTISNEKKTKRYFVNDKMALKNILRAFGKSGI